MHRDLKPENLFLVPTRSGEDFVKILDFGISKFTTPGMSSATMTGAVLGSPCYMAPEQARGLKNVDPRTDLYSVGTLLFECATGRVPFDGDNFNDLMFKIALSPRPNPLEFRPDLDEGIVPIIVKAIKAEANERYQTAEQFRDALLGWLQTRKASIFRADSPSWWRASREPRHATRRAHSCRHACDADDSTLREVRLVGRRDSTAASDSGVSSTPLSAASTLESTAPPVTTAEETPRVCSAFAAMGIVARRWPSRPSFALRSGDREDAAAGFRPPTAATDPWVPFRPPTRSTSRSSRKCPCDDGHRRWSSRPRPREQPSPEVASAPVDRRARDRAQRPLSPAAASRGPACRRLAAVACDAGPLKSASVCRRGATAKGAERASAGTRFPPMLRRAPNPASKSVDSIEGRVDPDGSLDDPDGALNDPETVGAPLRGGTARRGAKKERSTPGAEGPRARATPE